MAVYVKMIKKFDDEKRVVYQFGPNEKQMGEIEFDKEKKIFNILKLCLIFGDRISYKIKFFFVEAFIVKFREYCFHKEVCIRRPLLMLKI